MLSVTKRIVLTKRIAMKNSIDCKAAKMAIRDTLDIVGGKWKFILIAALYDNPMKFNELSRECSISPRILSKELLELEQNGLVNRKVCDTKPVTVEYSITEYCKTLDKLIIEMQNWGLAHREYVKKL